MKNSKPLSFPVKDFISTYPLITKEDITIGRNITGPTFLYTEKEHSHVLNAIQTSLPPEDNEIRLTETEMNNLFYAKNERFTLKKLCDAQRNDIALRQVREWKMFNNQPLAPTVEIRANKGLLHYYMKIKDIFLDHKEEINDSLLYIQTEKPNSRRKFVSRYVFSSWPSIWVITISLLVTLERNEHLRT